ncbi:MAG: helix-turn-helix transcriptional regulator [Lachnospiraceae bacterium]|nr:helix-turn-helix transcriptional regulator [Lachnospiraceae bacterium]
MRRAYPTIDMKATGRNIKRIMRAKGISVKEVQKYLGLSAPQGIYHWLDGRSMPTVDNLYALSELFRTPMDEIICGNRKYKPCVTLEDRLLTYCDRYLELKAG